MVSKYDVFYVIATKGEIRVVEIVETLNKPKEEYQSIFNHVLLLESEKHVIRKDTIKPIKNKKNVLLYHLIRFCVSNKMNYNLFLKTTMVDFIQKVSQIEFFTIKDVNINPRTFNLYTTALSKYGMLLIISRKPVTCKLLRHSFFIDLLNYYDRKIDFYEPEKNSFQKEIKLEIRKYKRNLKINYSILDDLEKQQEVDFIYSSLHLEGNPLTLPETQKLILEEVLPDKYKLPQIQEVTNYKKSVDLMIDNAKKKIILDLQLILKYHEIAMAHIHGAGQIRKQNVKIKGNPKFKTCEWQLIPVKIKELFDKYAEFNNRKNKIEDIIAFSAFFHNEFQRIHPFIDGNSRISRLLMLHILRTYDIPILDLPIGYFDLYLDLTKRSKYRDDEAFQQIIEEIIFFSLKRLNSRF
jgi:fido (protein-threonine AMPylation protein)